MKSYRISILIFVFFAILVASPWNEALSQRGGGHQGKGFLSNLTDEQREAVREKMEEMREQGATPEEIHTAVAEMLKGYGIEVPEDWKGPYGRGGFGPGPGGFWKDLTDEQRQAVQEKIKEMKDQGATREEIHTAVAAMLEGYGVKLPENRGEGHRGDLRQLLSSLTNEQRQAVREKIREMRRQGATCEEIHATVTEMLESYGIKLPKDSEDSTSEIAPAEPQIKAQNYPNPFNPQTEIAYSLPEDCQVKLTILNIQGQKVRVLVDEYQNAGAKKVTWDGCDESGERVASGVYFYQIEAGSNTVSNRMVLLK